MRAFPEARSARLTCGYVSVGEALRTYGEELVAAGAAQVGSAFSGVPEADSLLERSPNAFLLGVLFTQGIPAERAWAGPFLLQQRLGHLDMGRLARESEAVGAAVAGPPALHRFVKTLPRWIVSAASRLESLYAGLAQNVWPSGAHVAEVTRRLLEFDGIGDKKAAMAVGILLRHFGVPLQGIECGNVAYDVHVRRVFMRSGLVEADTADEVSAAAARACPRSPGTLDLAAWLVGRETCRPRQPLCDACRLGAVCPRRIGIMVDGVGVRTPRLRSDQGAHGR